MPRKSQREPKRARGPTPDEVTWPEWQRAWRAFKESRNIGGRAIAAGKPPKQARKELIDGNQGNS